MNRSLVEYVAGSTDIRRNEVLLMSHSVVTNCGMSVHLWSMIPTQAWEKDTLITHIPSFVVVCFNSYTTIQDRCSPVCVCTTLTVVEGMWYDMSRTQQELYSVWSLVRLGILHKSCACITIQPHSIGGLWVKQQQQCFQLSSLAKHIVLLRIHAPVKHRYWSIHPNNLSDHSAGIQLARKLTYWLK